MKTNPKMNQTIYEVLDNQLNAGNPPETKKTLNRLLKQGYSKKEARRLLALVITGEISEILKSNQPFNLQRFVKALDRLPEVFEE